MNRFITEYSWDEEKVNKQRLKELQSHNETRLSKDGVGIIDDTLLEKTGKKIPFVGKFFDHAKERYVNAVSMVSLHYADRKTSYPVDFKIYRKMEQGGDFRTKIELAGGLIRNSIKSYKMPAKTFVFDSFYTEKKLINEIESYRSRGYIINTFRSSSSIRGLRGKTLTTSFISPVAEILVVSTNPRDP